VFDKNALASLIQRQHLADDAISSYQSAFQSHPARFAVIEEFLVPDTAARLSEFLRGEAQFETEYGLYSVEDRKVDENEWKAALHEDRFFRFSKLVGTRPEFQLSRNSFTYLTFRTSFQKDDDLRTFFEDVTGIELAASDDFGSHSMEAGDFLKAHDDNNRNRRLALVLYLSPDWTPEYGGTLHILDRDGNESVVEAKYNSLVAFDTIAETRHYVAPITQAAGGRKRLTIGGWYHRPR
jgi:Rps23 Pro-64 3,4-dihydroxylase Tpa1-like proline 4-hydroxylase